MSINAILSTRIKDPKVEDRSAKSLFEDNGFYFSEDEKTITYTRVKKTYTTKIIFNKEDTTYTSLSERNGQIEPYHIRMSLLAAITRQVKELNWHVKS
ncbi:MAG: hypothetical protein KBT48_01535 [Firmicutes bacterium]|nr:hypothetical protein [Bacillota bacterium]